MEHSLIALSKLQTVVGIAISRTRIPYTVALVIVGLAAGAFNVLTPPRLTKELLFAVFLPGLVFEAAYNIHVSELRRTWRTVSTLAVPGVIVAIVPTGGAIAWLLGVSPRLTTLVEAGACSTTVRRSSR